MATFTIDSRIRVVCSEAAANALRTEFTHPNPDRRDIPRLQKAVDVQPHNRKLRGMLMGAMKSPESMPTWRDTNGYGDETLSLARGTLERAKEIVKEHERVELRDRMSDGDPQLGPVRGVMKYSPWDFQARMLEASLAGFQGMALAPTGSGKTVFGFLLALAVQVPTLVLVWSSGLMKDWMRRAQDEAGLREDDIGYIAGKDRKIRPLTIGMVQTLTKAAPTYVNTFGCVIADEIEKFAAQTLYAVGDVFPARYRIGIGAEVKRKDGKEFLTRDLFGPELIRVSREEVGDKILDVEHRLFETEFAPAWYLGIPEGAARGYAFNQLVDAAIVDKDRNALLAKMAAAEVREGMPVLAFSHRRDHVRMLEADLRREVPELGADATGVMLGGKPDEAEFERCTKGFRDGKLRFAGTTYQAASVGINLPSLPVGMLGTPTHNNTSRLNQTQGRLRRTAEGKAGARLYVPWDRGCFGMAPLRASLRMAKVVKVLVGNQWVDGRDYLKREEAREEAHEKSLDIFGGR